jgi:lipoic acid synthetase
VVKLSLSGLVLDNQRGSVGDFIKRKKPDWLRARLPGGAGYNRLRALIDEHNLHTVCESAKCPNMGECWARGTATIMILGDVCTRSCGFCHIKTGRPPTLDTDEPRRVGEAAAIMRLRHIVITSVNRDELDDGGAAIWAETIRQIRQQSPGTSIEVLIPDFCGDWDALQRVIDARPDILNHNMETVRRMYPVVRPQAKYNRSIELLQRCKQQGMTTKTGIMVGIGERDDEVEQLMRDVVEGAALKPAASTTGLPEGLHPTCDILTVGQYLQPTRNHLPITRWVTPEQFAAYKRLGESLGFRHVESGPLVRSSYHADEQVLHLVDPPAAV